MAQLAQEKLGDQASAIKLYDEVLDVDRRASRRSGRRARPHRVEVGWGCRAYKRMLARVRDNGDARLLHALNHQLGLVYRDRLGDRDGAIAAFRAGGPPPRLGGGSGHPARAPRHVGPGRERHRAHLRAGAARHARSVPYPALYDLLAQLGHRDRAYCVASVMVHLGTTHAAALADAAPRHRLTWSGSRAPWARAVGGACSTRTWTPR